uniref:Uncharacterized protein n=1 Tax=Salix viminalis TaxID=40686 RepID=A0A6N2MN76_SALVM
MPDNFSAIDARSKGEEATSSEEAMSMELRSSLCGQVLRFESHNSLFQLFLLFSVWIMQAMSSCKFCTVGVLRQAFCFEKLKKIVFLICDELLLNFAILLRILKFLQSEVASASSSKFLAAIAKAVDIHSYDSLKEEIRSRKTKKITMLFVFGIIGNKSFEEHAGLPIEIKLFHCVSFLATKSPQRRLSTSMRLQLLQLYFSKTHNFLRRSRLCMEITIIRTLFFGSRHGHEKYSLMPCLIDVFNLMNSCFVFFPSCSFSDSYSVTAPSSLIPQIREDAR